MSDYIANMAASVRRKIANRALQLARWADPALEIGVGGAPDYRMLGLADAVRGGWYRADTAELCEGFAIAPSDTVADIGCGDGGNLHFCARFAAHVIAVDTDQERLTAAENRFKSGSKATFAVMLGDAAAIPVANATADKILCTEVLEHVDDPAKVLSELVRIGKPGATYLLSVPDATSEFVLKRVGPKEAFEKPNHIRIIERNEFARMVERAGLVVKKRSYRGFYWSMWVALSWVRGDDLDFDRRHPVLDHWARTWRALIDHPRGQECKNALDIVMPKNQIIVAYKP